MKINEILKNYSLVPKRYEKKGKINIIDTNKGRYIYKNTKISSIFEDDYDVKRIISALEIYLHVSIEPGKTLLIFDEV